MKDKRTIGIIAAGVLLLGAAFVSFSMIEKNNTPEVPFSVPDNDPDFPKNSPSGYSLKCSRTYEPVCGETMEENDVCFGLTENTPCPKVKKQKTFPNKCSAQEAGAIILFEGTCEQESQRNYVSEDPQKCATMDIGCNPPSIYFEDETGCGCEVKPISINIPENTSSRRYVSQEESICDIKKYTCDEGEKPFRDEQGCGCETMEKAAHWSTSKNYITGSTDLPETLLFEGCPGILYELLCPEGYYKFNQGEECGCMQQQ